MVVISWRVASLGCSIDRGRLLYTFDLRYSQRQKSHWFKSGEREGQPMSPRNEIKWPGNISLKIPIARREVWAVAPSCWNQTLSISWSILNFGLKKVSSISQYRSEFTVTVMLSSSKKYGPHIPNSATPHHTVTRGQCKGGGGWSLFPLNVELYMNLIIWKKNGIMCTFRKYKHLFCYFTLFAFY